MIPSHLSEPARHRRSRANPFVFTLAALLALSACGGDGEAAPASQRPGGPVPPVEVAKVTRGSMSRSSTVTGAVQPLRQVGVNAQLAGVLTAVLVEEGDMVSQGQVIARIDDRELAAQVRAVEAQLRLAESTFERSEQLREAQVITAAEYERDHANLEAVRAQLDQLRTRIGFATINSPISGVVTERRLLTGDAVAPQTRLFTVADLGTLVVRLPVSELDVGSLRAGETVNLRMDALPDQMFRGRVRRVFPTADTSTRLVPVEVVLEGEGARLARPGYLARVSFTLDERENAMLVPVNAVLGTAGAEAVFVVEEQQATRRQVITGLRQNDRVEILSGLADGDVVIVAGHNTLRDGARVRVLNPPNDSRQAVTDSVATAAASASIGDDRP